MAPQDFTAPWRLSLDVVFVVEEQRVSASSAILAEWSSVMKAKFSDDFANKPFEIPLPQKKLHHVQELMKVLHPPNKEVDGDNVKLLLPLAKEFQMDALISKCERFLLLQPETIDNLVLAEQYELPKLRKKCVNDVIHEISVASLLKNESFKQLSDSTQAQIFEEKTRKLDAVVNEVKQIVAAKLPNGHETRYPNVPHRGFSRYNLDVYSCYVYNTHNGSDERYPHFQGSRVQCDGCRYYMVSAINERIEKLP